MTATHEKGQIRMTKRANPYDRLFPKLSINKGFFVVSFVPL